MRLFRKSPDISLATPRPITADDLTAVSRLLRDGGRRYYGLSGSDLPAILARGQGMALVGAGELLAVALVSQPTGTTCWLRGVAVAESGDARPAIAALLPPLHQALAARGVRSLYYAGDDGADHWLAPALVAAGYTVDTEVVVYEKSAPDIPAAGNPAVVVRPGAPADLEAVLRIDRASFEPHWTKDDTVLGPAIAYGPYFMVAELDGGPVGYAYATTHFGGRLVHLVRIAVDPRHRGEHIGVRLLADVVTYAADMGATTITLNTQAYNTHAQRLYRWFGFVATGERQRVLRGSLPS
ncbi:MAG: GNAT family N-acetyltransferase [Chloroflexi bacterium OHK40]